MTRIASAGLLGLCLVGATFAARARAEGEGPERVAVLARVPAGRVCMGAVFRPEEGVVAYLAVEGNDKFVVVGTTPGKKSAEYSRGLQFCSDGRVAYQIVSMKSGGVAVVGSQEETLEPAIWGPFVLPRQGATAYAHWSRGRAGNEQVLSIGGKEVLRRPRLEALGVSPDERRVTFTEDGKKLVVAVLPSGEVEREIEGGRDPVFSLDGKRLACVVGNAVWIDGQTGASYDRVGEIVFSADGSRVAYGALKGGRQTLVVDGKETGDWPYVDPNAAQKPGAPGCAAAQPSLPGASFSEDGKSLAILVHSTGTFVVGPEGEGPHGSSAGTPIWSRDGSTHSYVIALGNEQTLMVGGKEQGKFRFVRSHVLSPDGKHWAAAVSGGEGESVLVDGKPGPAFATVYGETLRVSADGTGFEYGAMGRRAKESDTLDLVWVRTAP